MLSIKSTVCSVMVYLDVIVGVPVTVVDDNSVGSRKIDSKTTGTST